MLLATEVLNFISLEGSGHWNYTLHKFWPRPTTRPKHFSQDQDTNKYERYYGPGRHPLPYLFYYMPKVSPACA